MGENSLKKLNFLGQIEFHGVANSIVYQTAMNELWKMSWEASFLEDMNSI